MCNKILFGIYVDFNYLWSELNAWATWQIPTSSYGNIFLLCKVELWVLKVDHITNVLDHGFLQILKIDRFC